MSLQVGFAIFVCLRVEFLLETDSLHPIFFVDLFVGINPEKSYSCLGYMYIFFLHCCHVYFIFHFFFYESTLLARQLYQERTQMEAQ